jgi:hypothetical protein
MCASLLQPRAQRQTAEIFAIPTTKALCVFRFWVKFIATPEFPTNPASDFDLFAVGIFAGAG